jgi:hypothetical protein
MKREEEVRYFLWACEEGPKLSTVWWEYGSWYIIWIVGPQNSLNHCYQLRQRKKTIKVNFR